MCNFCAKIILSDFFKKLYLYKMKLQKDRDFHESLTKAKVYQVRIKNFKKVHSNHFTT